MTSDASGWNRIALGDACLKIGSGATPRGGENSYTPMGVSLIRSQNVLDMGFSSHGLARIRDDAAYALRGVTVEPGDVLLNITGQSVARCSLVPEKVLPARVNQHVAIIRPDEQKLDSLFLQYSLIANKARLRALARAGATREALTKSMISEFEIVAPPIKMQRRISAVLGSLDEKLGVNRRLAQTQEEIVTALFKARFIDFIGHEDLAESEIGAIPRGWEVAAISDLCESRYGYTATGTTKAVGPKFLRVMDINKQPWIEWASVPYCEIEPDKKSRFDLRQGDLVVARMADPGKAALIEEEVDAVAASYLVRLRPRLLSEAYYLFGFLRSARYLNYCRATMSGSVQKNMNARVITAAKVAVPPRRELELHLESILPIRRHLNTLLRESEVLVSIRDSLLPRVMSGETSFRPVSP
jgi:type I restriction enzyme S subunit